jgi:hypothetical protein
VGCYGIPLLYILFILIQMAATIKKSSYALKGRESQTSGMSKYKWNHQMAVCQALLLSI